MAISFKGIPECPMVDERRWISKEWRMALTATQNAWTIIVDLATEVTGILRVVNGGTGRASLTAHYTLVGAGTSPVSLINPSTAGFVYTSNGAGADPSFQATGASGAGYWTELTNGDGTSPALIFDSFGDTIDFFVP